MTNRFFPYMQSEKEQHLIHSLLTEVIDTTGFDCYYVPRTLSSTLDPILTEDTHASFNLALPTTVYLQTAESFGGMGHFASQEGWQIQDQIILVMSRRTYEQDIYPHLPAQIVPLGIPQPERPVEGDLIYVPFNKRLFVIRFVEKYSMLYPLGALPTWRLQCEVYESTSEKFNTGIPGIDAFQITGSLDVFDWTVDNENGQAIKVNDNYWAQDAYQALSEDQTVPVHADANTFFDFSEHDPFGDAS